MDHIYGEKEAGGTSVLYLSSVPFEKLGFPEVGEQAVPGVLEGGATAVPPAVLAVGAMLARIYAFFRKRMAAVAGPPSTVADHHPEFEPLQDKLWTPFN